jgi:GT2 family glycosyltransferase
VLKVSVVVPTCGRPQLLRDCLRSLAKQDLDDGAFEIIVVDDGSPPATQAANAAVVQRLAHARPGLALHYVWCARNRGPAAARNTGWRKAAAPVVAFTDDDTRPLRDWLRVGLAAIEGCDAVAGRIVVPVSEQPTDYERDTAGLAHASFVTANAFVRKAALAAVGGFDERYRIAWREDADLEFALREQGFRIRRAPRAIVVHPVRQARWGVSVLQQRKVLFDALLYKKHPRDYRASIRRIPPWHYYAATAALVGVVIALARGNGTLALLLAVPWLAITVTFCARRLARTRRDPSHVLEMIATSVLIPPVSVFWRLAGAWRWRVPFL